MARWLAGESGAAWLKRIKADRELTAGVRGLRGFFLADAEDLSMLTIVEQFADGGAPGGSHMYRLREGNDALPSAMARELGADIHLRAPVRRITSRGRTVRVSGDEGDVTGDVVVCTLPATALRRIEFEPALPASQAEAIRRLEYGPAT